MTTPDPTTRRAFIACLALCPAAGLARAAREPLPLLLAQEAPADIDPAGYLVSEKYDGVRAYWDGRDGRDGRSLRFRSGLTVAAPAWFTQLLPATALDGELWFGQGRFDALSAAVRRHKPDDAEWRQVRFMVFELPGGEGSFAQRAARIEALVHQAGHAALVAAPQVQVAGAGALQRRLEQVVREGGEGLVLHRADAPYVSGRSAVLLKLKPEQDAEGQVIGHVGGRGKHAGRLGALRVRTARGVEFLIGTGLSDAQRASPPPLGSVVTFTYRGITPGGVPRFASYQRLRDA
ncbi:MAG: DNA ligase [Rubrivivax sp.]|nr:DNA ligase [Rubrivivax sp.]